MTGSAPREPPPVPERELPAEDDARLREESDAAASEAGAIGGRAPGDSDPAERPLKEAGEGEAEGFEEAERQLEENATHGEGRGFPAEDLPEPEESAGSEYGEADEPIPSDGPDER
jgi:hypothetical protein